MVYFYALLRPKQRGHKTPIVGQMCISAVITETKQINGPSEKYCLCKQQTWQLWQQIPLPAIFMLNDNPATRIFADSDSNFTHHIEVAFSPDESKLPVK